MTAPVLNPSYPSPPGFLVYASAAQRSDDMVRASHVVAIGHEPETKRCAVFAVNQPGLLSTDPYDVLVARMRQASVAGFEVQHAKSLMRWWIALDFVNAVGMVDKEATGEKHARPTVMAAHLIVVCVQSMAKIAELMTEAAATAPAAASVLTEA